ncbi:MULTISPECIES: PTS glucitol/sorbitol transporter subunit IIB [Prauserella salsuginis group]|uniref:PTS system glucitol/sorbitol-specific IIC component n=2 Tax=Prauserella salsuginis group TaxID=2893672 RepID=A0A839XFL5_9PSEU|nr:MULTISPECIES: PTS glucitol/sorbitol transporter subunit IIB [Prauserella salsuginis group]MBB3661217.1 PTS system glucitol/sorbitol-specific IIC component [Prauserella sediminis]MCR3719078.1 PTS system, glucitol/sorbitol-specific IIC component [Prauserella flava]MCR3733648.1 PTS system, glucitol/sorbitol-specific IIC component [Prauserella salsuginis]
MTDHETTAGQDTTATDTESSTVFVRAGAGGWGPGLTLRADETRTKVLSVTGGGIHPVAQKIADLTGAEAVDGFNTSVPDDEVVAAVINCGGTARIGVYPRKGIPTVDVYPGAPGGPLAKFITEELFVSAVGMNEIARSTSDGEVAAGGVPSAAESSGASGGAAPGGGVPPRDDRPSASAVAATLPVGGPVGKAFHAVTNVFVGFGSAVGTFVNTMLAAGRQTVDLTLKTILPFMAYVSLLLGIVMYTGVAEWMGRVLSPIASNPFGLLAISFVVALPFLSPVLGPGAAIAQVVGTLMGSQIAIGALPVQYALPTLFAINGQVGCDFVPVGLALGEAKPETVAVGTPAVLISRMITSPLAVVIAWAASFGL